MKTHGHQPRASALKPARDSSCLCSILSAASVLVAVPRSVVLLATLGVTTQSCVCGLLLVREYVRLLNVCFQMGSADFALKVTD